MAITLACTISLAQGVVVGRVARVADGDTVTVLQQDRSVVLRLAGIDAPEMRQSFGREARDNLVGCALGRLAVVNVSGTDRHGRLLGTLEAGGVDCGLDQLRKGMAWHYRHFAYEQAINQRHRYAAAERAARKSGDGLWQHDNPTPPWAYRREHPGSSPRSPP